MDPFTLLLLNKKGTNAVLSRKAEVVEYLVMCTWVDGSDGCARKGAQGLFITELHL